ncbi:MAG TPA: DMT family transporter [Gammaproteobacteria bacterium]|jgi:drug/metabolite transporter (DMT)-like permease|nr:DMT family transporter [Gammaproteobacteria bacterium]HIB07768.1 DMT family transporter [Gammaproteobacteria bacterium]HIB82106.1 DMT family transporter [Gammaproteobacteria bacterium]
MGGVSCFTTTDTVIKYLSGDYALHQIVLIRAVIGIVFTLVVFVPFDGGLETLRTNRLLLHLVRGFCVVMANLLFFTGLATLPLGETVALVFVAPLIITVFAAIFLREKVSAWRWSAVGVGLAGTLIMIRPGTSLFNPMMLLPVLAALCYATFQILSRYLGRSESASSMAVYTQLMFIAISALIGVLVGDGRFTVHDDPTIDFLLRAWVWPSGRDLVLLSGIGILSGLGAYLISQGYRLGEASLLAPFEYTSLPFAILWSILFFGDWPDLISWVGIGMIFSAGMWALMHVNHNERQT